MTKATTYYVRGKSPWTIACNPQCESDGKSTARRKAIRTAFYKVHASGSFSFNDESTWPPVQTMVCHRCGKDFTKTQPAKAKAVKVAQVETASQNGQAFDAMQDARDDMREADANGKFSSGYSTKLASKIAAALGCSFGDARPRASKVCNAVKREFKLSGLYGSDNPCFADIEFADETKADKAEREAEYIKRISGKPQTKPAPKAQAKPVPTTDGSIEVMDAALFGLLAEKVPVEIMEITTVIEVETITINGLVFRCS